MLQWRAWRRTFCFVVEGGVVDWQLGIWRREKKRKRNWLATLNEGMIVESEDKERVKLTEYAAWSFICWLTNILYLLWCGRC